MIFRELSLSGAYVVVPEPKTDERGLFARTWCAGEFAARGLNDRIAECTVSFSSKRGTLRGLHYQIAPHAQAKLVTCLRGAIYDVIVDIRPGSPTYGRWVSVELSAANWTMLYVPEGFAHGFQTLEEDTEVFYQMSDVRVPEAERGIRWDDPAFSIEWPPAERTISPRDLSFKDFPP